MKHWVVKVDAKTYVIEAETAQEADSKALHTWLYENNIFVENAVQVFCPCQWGEECPDGIANCGDCSRKMKAKSE